MYGTGIVVLLFLLLHLSDFRFGIRNPSASSLPQYERAQVLLRDPLTAIVYIIGSCALGYHVSHGLQSALQTLGFNHPKYNGLLRTISKAFGLIVALGFGSFPIWALAFHS
jgi:succinate dehydrogenase / fumarate reductase cytochrome b subunit